MRIFFFTLFTLFASICLAQKIQPVPLSYDSSNAIKDNATFKVSGNVTIINNLNVDTKVHTYTITKDTAIFDTNYIDTTVIDTILIDSITPTKSTLDTITRNTIIQAQVTDTNYNGGITIDTIINIIGTGDTLGIAKTTTLDTINNVTYINKSVRDTIAVNDTLISPSQVYTIIKDTLLKVKVSDTTIVDVIYSDSVIRQTVTLDTINSSNPKVYTITTDTTIMASILIARKLPFFDDFSTTPTGNPSTLRWTSGGGAYVNNEYPRLPPSQYVVTLDALNEQGVPYSALQTYGAIDTLTSWTIDISKHSPADSVYLSFYWQGGGYGEPPVYNGTEADSLALFFKDESQIWHLMWSQRGASSKTSTSFNQVIIGLKDSIFFHKTFQFRLAAWGAQFMAQSVWNIDYVILNSGRTYTDTTHPDITIVQGPGHILKNYTAMPADQFFANPTNELADSITLSIKNWGHSGKYFSSGVGMTAIVDSSTVFPLPGATTSNPFPGNTNLNAGDTALALVAVGSIANLKLVDTTFQIIYTKIKLQTPDTVFAGIDYRANDTITVSTAIKDYYAYDDGTAEWPVEFITTENELAVQFSLNIIDTLTAVDIYFPQYTYNGNSVEGTDLSLKVWDSINVYTSAAGSYDNPIYTENISLTYSELNQFVRYQLDSALPMLSGKSYYVGLGMGLDPNLKTTILLGYDANNSYPGKFFCNSGGVWTNSNCIDPGAPDGSFMIRPVFSNKQNTPLGVIKSINTLECSVYPNPSDGLINITGKVNTVKVYDITATLVATHNYNSMDYSKTINLQNLSAGLYLVYLSNENASAVKKIIIAK